MSDEQPGTQGSRGPEVGSVAEEAAKLFGALSGWAREQGADTRGPEPAPGPAVRGLVDALGSITNNVNEHLATGGEDCRYCPVCQVIHVVRETNPEVRAQLATAASSLLHAAATLVDTKTPRPRSAGVEKIDLSEGSPWDDER
ncbi:MAG: hypothetical protein M3Y66_01010 [Actinomycetota bacterium]|nr:hypothetical protein [Actinomycetota bacterium]